MIVGLLTPCYNRVANMSTYFLEIFNLLTIPPGNLIYHLVLVFSIGGALQGAFMHWRISEFPQARRTVIGLLILLLLQIGLFLVSGLAWQGIVNSTVLLPLLDRAVMLIGSIWLIWVWAFPEPSRSSDAASILLTLFTAAGMVLNIVEHQAGAAVFNGSLADIVWQTFSLGILAVGLVILLVRRPNGWGNGFAFLCLGFIGHLLHALFNGGQGDYAGIVRLTYLMAYPLLLTLPQRFPVLTRPVTVKQVNADIPERRRYSTDPKTFHSLLSLAGEVNADKVSQAITRAIAQTMLADLCFLLFLTDDRSQIIIPSGYDLIREEKLDGASILPTSIPMLASALQRGRALRLPASSTSGDLRGLGDLLGLSNPGHLMFVPILTAERQPLGGLLLLSPYSNRLWSSEDQSFLANIANALTPILQRNQQVATLEDKSLQAAQAIEEERARTAELQEKNRELARQLEEALQQVEKYQETAENLAAMTTLQNEAQRLIVQLQAENEELRKAAQGLPKAKAPDISHVERELRLTLEEVARLQNQLAEANIKILELENQKGSPRTNEQAEIIASISQELRQPMSSIIGYTDLLLGESVGILGALQRKFVERIKASTERIRSLIDDLIQITTIESGLTELKPEAVDLNLVIDNAVAYTSSQIREKNITMHLDLPKSIAPIQADREALQQILIHLLQNAGAATPMEGTISLQVKTRTDGGQEYIMIQVSDTGGGISAEDLPRVFSRLYRADNVLIQGIGDTGVGLSIAKTLTEAQHGRIWVESEPGVGATFSVLLPVSRPPVSPSLQGA